MCVSLCVYVCLCFWSVNKIHINQTTFRKSDVFNETWPLTVGHTKMNVKSGTCFVFILTKIMKNFSRHSSHGHHGSKRRKVAQHALTWIARIHSHTYIKTVTTTNCIHCKTVRRSSKNLLQYNVCHAHVVELSWYTVRVFSAPGRKILYCIALRWKER